MVSTPATTGSPSRRSFHWGSAAMSATTSFSRPVTCSRSSVTDTGMSMTARDQSLDRLVTWRRALLGTTTSSPWAVRTLVTRRVSSSTVPVTPSGLARHRQADDVAEGELVLGEEEEPGQQVPDHLLGAEAEADADHRGRGHQRGEGDPQPVEARMAAMK